MGLIASRCCTKFAFSKGPAKFENILYIYMFSFLVKGSSIQKSAKKKVGERESATGGDNSVCVCVCVCVCVRKRRERGKKQKTVFDTC